MAKQSKLVPQSQALSVAAARDVGGIEMGVFADGSPFLTASGLAAISGVSRSVINQMAKEFDTNSGGPRGEAINELLEQRNYGGDALFFKINFNGQVVNAYPEVVVMVVLEYYAHHSERTTEQAKRSLEKFGQAGLRAFVHLQLNYDPTQQIPSAFKAYHDRLLLNRVPKGYFSCFTETSHVVIDSIRHGLPVDSHTVPDISVGIAWAKYWKSNNLEAKYGPRKKYPHKYPDDHPQAVANNVIEPNIYPTAALVEFRTWLETEYLPRTYPKYLKSKQLPPSRADLLIASLVPPQLEDGDDEEE